MDTEQMDTKPFLWIQSRWLPKLLCEYRVDGYYTSYMETKQMDTITFFMVTEQMDYTPSLWKQSKWKLNIHYGYRVD